jgi:hypothetical protein
MPKPGNADFFAALVEAVNDPIISVEDLAGHSIVELGDKAPSLRQVFQG